jgi:hypothetical protein
VTATPTAPNPAGFDQNNPKAAAKAAKAYAKATRPWFKKKRWWLVGLIAIIVIASVAGGGGSKDNGPKLVDDKTATSTNDTSKAADTAKAAAEKPEPAKVGTKANPVPLGKTVELEGTRYTVNAVKKSATAGDNEFLQEKADGTFVIVTLTIENTKDETKTFSSSAVKFATKDGKEYSTDDDGTIAVMGDNEEALVFADMQPDLPKKGKLVFDVPPAKTAGGLLKVEDLFGRGEAYIKLGLK